VKPELNREMSRSSNLGPEQSRSCEKWFKQVQVYWRNNTCLIKSGKFRTYIYICVTYTYASAIIVYLRRDILSVDGRNHGALYLENFPSDNTNMERSLSENRVYPQDFI
jgi:hypothetical protein